jgi:uncharacterized protein YbbC (DUF1343 family)
LDPETFPSLLTGLAVIKHARAQAPRKFAWRENVYEFVTDRLAIDLLLGRPHLRPMLEAGALLGAMTRTWEADQRAFATLRQTVLRYR